MGGACLHCGKGGDLICSRCRIAWYCSQACQKADWKGHKAHCAKPKAEAEWPADEGGVRITRNASPDEAAARVQQPQFLLDRNRNSHPIVRLFTLLAPLAVGITPDARMYAAIRLELDAGADPLSPAVLLGSAKDLAHAQALWTNRKPGIAGLEAAVRATPGSFLPPAVAIASDAGEPALLAFLLQNCRAPVTPERLNRYNATLEPDQDNPSTSNVRISHPVSMVVRDSYKSEKVVAARPAMLELLLKAGADPLLPVVGQYDGDWEAAPPVAASYPHAVEPPVEKAALASGAACMRLLVQHGADLNKTSSDGSTLLTEAFCNFGYVGTDTHARLVLASAVAALELGADPNVRAAYPKIPYRPLDALAMTSQPDCCLVSKPGRAPLFRRAAEALHKAGADFTPVPFYVSDGKGSMGAPNSYLWYLSRPCPCAFEVLKFAVEVAGVSADTLAGPKTPLFTQCCRAVNLPGVRLLMARGADPTVPDNKGNLAVFLMMLPLFADVKDAKAASHKRVYGVPLPPQADMLQASGEVVQYEMRWRMQKGLQPLCEYLQESVSKSDFCMPGEYLVNMLPSLLEMERDIRGSAT